MDHTGGTAPAPARIDRARWSALVVLCVGMLMIVLDITVVNVALPTIQRDLGFTQSGLAWAINGYLIPFGGLIVRFGARRLLVTGLVLIGAGMALFAPFPVDGTYLADVLPAMLSTGVGVGLAMPGLMTLAMADAAPEDAGLASGLVNTTAEVGAALGLAVLATLSATRSHRMLGEGAATADALTGGYRLALLVGAGLVAACVVIAVTVIGARRATRPAEPAAELAYAEAP